MRTGKHQGCSGHDVANVDSSRYDVFPFHRIVRHLREAGIMLGYIAGVALHAVSDGKSPECTDRLLATNCVSQSFS